jgi:hypothetical protein
VPGVVGLRHPHEPLAEHLPALEGAEHPDQPDAGQLVVDGGPQPLHLVGRGVPVAPATNSPAAESSTYNAPSCSTTAAAWSLYGVLSLLKRTSR